MICSVHFIYLIQLIITFVLKEKKIALLSLPYDVGPARVFLGEAEKTPFFAGQCCRRFTRALNVI